jgi:glutathione S-transferase
MARITLAEKKLKVREAVVNPWELEPEFIELTAEAMPPVLVDLTQHGTLLRTQVIILRRRRLHSGTGY